jgi:integrase
MKNPRGVYEKVPGSGEHWIRYVDADGRYRREKAGTKGAAIVLYRKRKTEALQGKKLPETLRRREVKFSELAEDAREYVRANNIGYRHDLSRIGRLDAEFGSRPASIPIEDFRRFFNQSDWTPATFNRYKSMLSLICRLGIEHRKIDCNPAKFIKRRHEDNGRVRFLDQHCPSPTTLGYLTVHRSEEARLRAVIEAKYDLHMPEFIVALHTGMRPTEQYSLEWDRIDLVRRLVSIPKSKNGKARNIRLNSEALAAFKVLAQRAPEATGPVFINAQGERLKGYKHWFDPAVKEAGIRDFTWYCLRHAFASRLVMAAVDIRTVAELMGHKTIQMSMRYAHLAPEHNLAAVERLTSFTSFNSYADAPSPADSSRPDTAVTEAPTGTTIDTALESADAVASEVVQ